MELLGAKWQWPGGGYNPPYLRTLQPFLGAVQETPSVNVEVPVLVRTITAYAPTVVIDVPAPETKGVGAGIVKPFTLYGSTITFLHPYAPWYVAGEPPTLARTITTYAPDITLDASIYVEVPRIEVNITTYPPEVTAVNTVDVTVPVLARVITTHAPLPEATANLTVVVPPTEINIVTFPPLAGTEVNAEVPVYEMIVKTYPPVIEGITPRTELWTAEPEQSGGWVKESEL